MPGISFLSKKAWHPTSLANQKQVHAAEAAAIEQHKKETERALEIAKEMEMQQYEQAGDLKRDPRTSSLKFMYSAPQPADDNNSALTAPAERLLPGEDDSMVQAFKDKLYKRSVPSINPSAMQLPESSNSSSVVCPRCGMKGHSAGDISCPAVSENTPHEWARQHHAVDATTYMNEQLPTEKQKLVLKQAALPREVTHSGAIGGYDLVGPEESEDEDETDPEAAFLATLTSREKRLLLERLQQLEDGTYIPQQLSDTDEDESSDSSSDSSSSSSDSEYKRSKKRRRHRKEHHKSSSTTKSHKKHKHSKHKI